MVTGPPTARLLRDSSWHMACVAIEDYNCGGVKICLWVACNVRSSGMMLSGRLTSSSTPGWGQICHFYENALNTRSTLAPAMFLHHMCEPSTRSVPLRAHSRQRPPLTHTNSAPSRYNHSTQAVPAHRGHAPRTLYTPLCFSGWNPRLRRKKQAVQQRQAAAHRRGSSMYAPAVHESSA